jgi:hypothetical protein
MKSTSRRPSWAVGIVALAMVPAAAPAAAQSPPFSIIGGNVQKRANGVLALMGYQLTPDVTTGSLSLANDASGDPDFSMVSVGGGFTFSKDFPLYVEGTAAYSRYDPAFIASDGREERQIPTRWNSVSGTGGAGWDFPIVENVVFRPIFNFSLGHVESDLAVAERIIERRTGSDIEFLENGRLNAYGLGGSVMLDYERYRPENEIDVELRYTNIYLQSTSGTSEAVKGSASAQSASLWSRWRAPTGLRVLERPVRYVLELAHTQFLGDLRGVLGFDSLTSLGTGFELDSSAYDIFVTRTRVVGRFQIGDNVRGWSIGIAVSF